MNPRERKLHELRLRMNEARVKNRKEARKEFERNTDPNYKKSQKQKEWQNYKQQKREDLKKSGVAEEDL